MPILVICTRFITGSSGYAARVRLICSRDSLSMGIPSFIMAFTMVIFSFVSGSPASSNAFWAFNPCSILKNNGLKRTWEEEFPITVNSNFCPTCRFMLSSTWARMVCPSPRSNWISSPSKDTIVPCTVCPGAILGRTALVFPAVLAVFWLPDAWDAPASSVTRVVVLKLNRDSKLIAILFYHY